MMTARSACAAGRPATEVAADLYVTPRELEQMLADAAVIAAPPRPSPFATSSALASSPAAADATPSLRIVRTRSHPTITVFPPGPPGEQLPPG
jgi:hypothetical protein